MQINSSGILEAAFSAQRFFRVKQFTSMPFEERASIFTSLLGQHREVRQECGVILCSAKRLTSSHTMNALEPRSIPVQAGAKLIWCHSHSHYAAIAADI
jgi:hypothetical protein